MDMDGANILENWCELSDMEVRMNPERAFLRYTKSSALGGYSSIQGEAYIRLHFNTLTRISHFNGQ